MKNSLIKILYEKNLMFRDNGDWIQICNPWVHDTKFHMGINVDKDFYNCFKTNMTGDVLDFVSRLCNCDREEAKKLLGQKTIDDYIRLYKNKLSEENKKRRELEDEIIGLPPGCIQLKKQRGMMGYWNFAVHKLQSEELVLKSKFYICNEGRWRGFLIMPYYEQGNILYYIGRNIDKSSKMRYLYPSKDIGKHKSDFLFNVDNANKNLLIICEGGFNSIVVDGVGLGGRNISPRQLEKIVSLQPKKVIVALDQDKPGRDSIRKACEKLMSYDLDVYFLWTDHVMKEDFADLGRRKSIELLKKFTYKCNVENFLKIDLQ